jgi:hypothetical protein
MKVSEATDSYVAHKQSMGMRFRTESPLVTSFWQRKYCCLPGSIYLATRLIHRCPEPFKALHPFVPYIYSREEVRRFA